MKAVINPRQLAGKVTAPPSKSMMQRACAAALLHKGKTVIYHYGTSDDDKAALNIIQQLGANIVVEDDAIEIISNGINPESDTIHCGESGLSARLFIPIAALSDMELQITGEGSLLNRPMNVYEQLLPRLGVTMKSEGGKLPFIVKGPLQPKDIVIDGSLSSQFLSGLLLTYAFAASKPVTMTAEMLNSKPYIDMTLQMLDFFGKKVGHEKYRKFFIKPDSTIPQEVAEVTIENDWSSAVPWLVAGAMGNNVVVNGLNIHSKQADKTILNVLKQAGVNVNISTDRVEPKASMLQAFSVDATDSPDLFPLLAILAGSCEGESEIKGLNRLLHKESNRQQSIMDMLAALRVEHRVEGNSLYVTGRKSFESATIDSNNDHRIAMAAAIASVRAKGQITIINAQAVSKSYPNFFKDFQSLQGDCIITE